MNVHECERGSDDLDMSLAIATTNSHFQNEALDVTLAELIKLYSRDAVNDIIQSCLWI